MTYQVEKIIKQKIKENKLSKENFAFFYYNLENKETYFYSKEKWFIGASTTKVQIAMIYYEMIKDKKVNEKDMYLYKKNHYEAGNGIITNEYKVGDKIPLKKLLYEMIVNSDNTATNILAEALGGRKIYRKYFEKYTKTTLPDEFYTENIISASYGLDVLKYLYENSNIYKELIENMKKSSFGKYLKKYISSCEIAHKYGSYKGNIHDYGIVYGKKTYFIGIFTKNIENAEELIATISKEIFEIE